MLSDLLPRWWQSLQEHTIGMYLVSMAGSGTTESLEPLSYRLGKGSLSPDCYCVSLGTMLHNSSNRVHDKTKKNVLSLSLPLCMCVCVSFCLCFSFSSSFSVNIFLLVY